MSWSLTLPVEQKLLQKASAALQSELRRFAKMGITGDELSEIKRYLAARLPVKMMPSAAETAKNVLNEYLQNSEPNIPWDLVSRIRSTDLNTVNNFIKNEFKPDQSVLIVIGAGTSGIPTRVEDTSTEVSADDGSISGAD
jgi:predicted Zn-dependent peptidase